MSEQRFSLDTFDVETFRFQNIGKTVYSKGTGPGVVVLAEMPGIHPLVIRFAERVAAAGPALCRAFPVITGISSIDDYPFESTKSFSYPSLLFSLFSPSSFILFFKKNKKKNVMCRI